MPVVLGPVPGPCEEIVAELRAAARFVAHPAGHAVPDYATLFPVPVHTGVPLDTPAHRVTGVGRRRELREFVAEFGPTHELCTGFYDDCGRCRTLLTPRLAAQLVRAADALIDYWRGEDSEGDLDFALELALPPVAHRCAVAHPGWAGRLLGGVRDLKLVLVCGRVPRPNSTAEEMALHLVLDEAASHQQLLADVLGATVADAEEFVGLPGHGRADADLARLREELFCDEDVLMLFDPALDGLEIDEDLAERMNLVNLHPRDWFAPFRAACAHRGPYAFTW